MNRLFLYLAWFQAIIATLGSLFLSEILHWTPCLLCWYQRILMYPLVLIIAVGILRKDKGLPLYVLPISILGLLISFYHNLLQWGIISEAGAPCTLGVSCVSKYAGWFGFVTVPLLSFVAFAVITVFMLLLRRTTH